MKTLQEITIKLIEATGWTQQELAERIGVSQPTIHRMLNGKCDDCMGETRLKLQEIYLEYGNN